MSDTFIPVDELEWKTVKIHKISEEGPEENHEWRYELELFEPLASWDVWAVWERERIDSMQKHIKQGDVVIDVGAEQGWMSALISKYMSSNIVLIEPTTEFWPGIKAIWDKNGLQKPASFFQGFANAKSDDNTYPLIDWPSAAMRSNVIEKRKYENIFDAENHYTKSVAIDDFQLKPDHITIDVEGAELHVLKGAEKTLKEHKPLVWVSVHPDMMERDYNTTVAELLLFMEDCGYEYELLAVDHENHFYFWPKGE